MNEEPRILTLTGAPHPKALVQRIDPANGILVFAWLDANGNRVDSGKSITRFAPVEPLPKESPTDETVYPEIEDAVLIDAIENPPAVVVPVPKEVRRRQLLLALHAAGITRTQIRNLVQANEVALIEYEEALTFKRNHPLINTLGQAFNRTPEQVDAFFIAAGGL